MLNISRRERYSNLGKKKIVDSGVEKIDLVFDLQALQLMMCYVLSQNRNIKRSHLINLRNLFEIIDFDKYKNDPEKIKRVEFIKKGLDSKLNLGLKEPMVVIKSINGGLSDENLIDINEIPLELSNEELEWLNGTISKSIQYCFMYNDIKRMRDICIKFETSDYRDRDEIVEIYYNFVSESMGKFRRSKAENSIGSAFTLREGIMEEQIKAFHEIFTNPAFKLITGMQGMNELIGGGYEGGRCYLYLGAAGMGKSTALLNIAIQIKKNNKYYQPKDRTKIPCIVLLTMENTVQESVERLFNIATTGIDIRNFTADEVIQKLRTEGELYLTDESPIDLIIKYVPNGAVDTGYLYTLVEELEDDGYECICLLQDYVRRIRSAYKTPDLRIELGEIINEFKTFAILKDIPVITAGQLNREGSRTLDDGKINNKSDLIRSLGRANIGESMLMIDNSDWVGIIDLEYDTEGNKYLGLKVAKVRFKILSNREVLFLPFMKDNSIRLMEDVNLTVPLFRDTLRDETLNVKGFNNGKSVYSPERKDIDTIIAERNNIVMEDNIFNMSKYVQNKKRIHTEEPIHNNEPSIINNLNIIKEDIPLEIQATKKFNPIELLDGFQIVT